MDVVRQGDHLYVLQDRDLVILSVKDRVRPVVVGKLEEVGNLRQIAVRENVAYITAREDGFTGHWPVQEIGVADVQSEDRAAVSCGPRTCLESDHLEMAAGKIEEEAIGGADF